MTLTDASRQPPFDHAFETFEAWRAFFGARTFLCHADWTALQADRIQKTGFREPLTDRVARAGDVLVEHNNYRETIVFEGLNARHRASLKALADCLGGLKAGLVQLYLAEAVTPLAKRLKKIFPKLQTSEYDPDGALWSQRVRHEDIQHLSFKDSAFDVVMTNDVLEHIPDLDRALRETRRVVKPGGWHISTHPFRFMSEASEVRARLVDGAVDHILEPEYHGDPVNPEGGVLVFETPGWDILDRLKAAGFDQAYMRFICDPKAGVLSDVGGVFVTIARAPTL